MAEEWFRTEGARCFLNRERYADADEQEIAKRRLALSRAARAAAVSANGKETRADCGKTDSI